MILKTVQEAFFAARQALSYAAQEEAAFEARLLVRHALNLTPEAFYKELDAPVSTSAQAALDALVARRRAGEPLQYILGEWEFMGLPFFTPPGVLIPRQDTETLAEHALKLIEERGYTAALDLCCGTGCIGISLRKLSGVSVTLADIDAFCLETAKINAARNGVEAAFVQSDLFSAVPGPFSLIACNPPYIPTGDLAALQKEVRFEPRLALDGGLDGLSFYRRIAAEHKRYLTPRGALLLEVGMGQASDVAALFENASVLKDLCGVERVVAVDMQGGSVGGYEVES